MWKIMLIDLFNIKWCNWLLIICHKFECSANIVLIKYGWAWCVITDVVHSEDNWVIYPILLPLVYFQCYKNVIQSYKSNMLQAVVILLPFNLSIIQALLHAPFQLFFFFGIFDKRAFICIGVLIRIEEKKYSNFNHPQSIEYKCYILQLFNYNFLALKSHLFDGIWSHSGNMFI